MKRLVTKLKQHKGFLQRRKELAIVFAGRIGLSVLSLLYLKLLLVFLDDYGYGLYTFIFATASWLNLLVFGAINIPITNFSANYGAQTDSKSIFQSFVTYAAVPAFLVISAVSLAVYFYSADVEGTQAMTFAVLTGLFATAIGSATMVSGFVLGQRRRVFNLLINNGVILSRILAIGCLAILVGFQFDHLILGVTIANVSVAITAVFFVQSRIKIAKPEVVWAEFASKNVFKEYKHNWIVNVGANILLYGDKVILAFVVPLEILGILAIYQQICRVIANLTIGTFYQFVSPFVLNKSGELGAKKFLIQGLLVTLTSFIPMIILVWLLRPLINSHLLDGTYNFEMLPFILVSITVALTQTSKTNELLFFKKDIVQFLKMPLICSILVFALAGLPLAFQFGLMGAVIGLLAAAVVRYVIVLLVLFKKTDL